MQNDSRPPLAWVGPSDDFPPSQQAWTDEHGANGLLAVGSSLTTELLIRAYGRGVFPWSSSAEPVLWWTPNPRMVLPVAHFRCHRSIRQAARQFAQEGLVIRFDQDFGEVMSACAEPRKDEAGTWITDNIRQAYLGLHDLGLAHCVGLYQGQRLLAGLYFVNLGAMVFGESMFTRVSNGSKVCLAALVHACRQAGVALIDCQQETSHLASLGASPMARADFEQHLKQTVEADPISWPISAYDWSVLTHPVASHG
ncbi:MAG: leucyl/phenylalanyl-tRNA--protein transferase [Betaproteobacteria bacterium]|nr:leucyl/phenylalanyl-tRNA--protein transferase [Betaproteobacteria bacterium]